jgi:hypothetical protein
MWQQALTGTAALCLMTLVAGLLCSLLPLLTCTGSLVALLSLMERRGLCFLCEAPFVTIVGFAIFCRAVRYEASWASQRRLQPQIFQITKLLLALLIAFACSQDAAQLLYAGHPLIAEIVQSQSFVLLSLLALRWSFQDQEGRCKHCSRSLTAPSRVGRPSWNFLDSNGTELICREGHGVLSIPELETSWRRSSQWIAT